MKKIIVAMLTAILLASALIAPAWAVSSVNVDFSGLYKEIARAADTIAKNRTITYDCNGGKFISWDGEKIVMTDSAVYYPGKASHTVPYDIPIKFGYIFTGWLSSDGNVYFPGDTLSEIKCYTMTAQWERAFGKLTTQRM